jgi:hypothetical protein
MPLGPTNPWLIDITKETLIFRRAAFSAALRLLVPTFLLPHAPEALAGPPSTQSGTLSYHSTISEEIIEFSHSVPCLAPIIFDAKSLDE